MSEDLASTIKINADASGVEAGVNSAKRSISSLGQAASQAGKTGADGMDRLGTSGDAAAKKIEASTRNTIASIQRQTAALEAGGASSRAYQESLAKMRGIDVGALKPYLDQLDAAKSKATQAATANAKLGDSLGMLKTAAVAFAGVASFNAFKDMVQGSIQAAAGLHDMSIQTGASVAALMAFRSVAATTNTSVEGIASAMNRAAKGMAVANEDSKGIGQAVKALGLDFDVLRKMKPEDQMLAVAKAMDGFQDGAGKAAAAMALYGKEGAKMLPFLKDLADESETVTKKLTEQQVEAKKAQAAMADDYTDNLVKIKKASEAWKKDVSMAMLPALYELSQAFLDVNKSAGGIKQGISDLSSDGTITEWSRSAVFGVTYVMDAFQGLSAVAKSVGKAIGVTLALTAENVSMVWKVMTGLLGKEPVINFINASMERQKVIAQSLADDLDKTWGEETLGAKLRARMKELQGVAVAAKSAKPDVDMKDPGATKNDPGKISDYQKLIRLIAEKQSQDEAQLAIGKDLSESEKIRAKLLADIATGTVKLTKSEQDRIGQGLDQLALTERQIAADKYYEEQQKARYAASSALVKSAQDEADKNEALARTFGMSRSAIEALDIARLEEQLAQKTSINQCTEETAKLEALIAAKKRSAAALGSVETQQAAVDAAKKAAEEWKKTAESINNSITDALMRGFESGKGFAENLRDTVANMFKTLVLRPTVSAIVNPVAQGITGMMGFSGAANAAGTASGMSDFGGAMGALSIGGSTIAAIGSSVATGVSAGLAGTSLAEATAAYSAAGMSGVAGGLSVGSSIGSALAAMGPVGWAALAAGAVLALADHGKPTANTGNASAAYDRLGNRTDYQTFYGGSSEGVDKMLASLQDSYTKAAKTLGIGAAATQFSYGGNTGKNGESPNFALGGGAGSSRFYQGETTSSDAAIQLAASRAVFAALQGSDLPAYLSKIFDGLSAGALTQDQITGTLAYAQSLKSVRDALLETREPLQILKDNVAQGVAALGTSAESFKADFVAAIDAGITPDKLAQWQGLQTAMTDLAAASGKATEAVAAAGRSIADIANERTRLQDQLDQLTMTSAQMLDKQRGAIDGSNQALFDQVQAAQAAKDAVDAANQAMLDQAQAAKESAAAFRQAAADRLTNVASAASDAYAGVERAVAAQRAQEQSAAEAQRAIAAAAFTSQSAIYQEQMDRTKASLDAVTLSVGKLKSLSGSLKSAIEGMRFIGSASDARAQAQAQIRDALATAKRGGGLPVDGQLSAALSVVTKPSEQLFASFQDYARDFYKTANDLSALSDLADAQITADEITQGILKDQTKQLEDQQKTLKDGFDAQVSGLDAILANAKLQLDAANGINTSVLSVGDALAAFNAAISKLAGERSSQGMPTTAGVADSRAAAIRDYISAQSSTLTGADLANTIATKAREVGVSEGEIATAIGWTKEKVRAYFEGAGIPQFAVGTNYVPQDMTARIHEGEAIVPKAYNPAVNRSGSDLMLEFRALREEIAALRAENGAENRAIINYTLKTSKSLDRAMPDGDAIATRVAA